MSTVELFRFEDTHQIRTVEINGRRLAVAADICAALDIKDASASLARIDADDKLILRRSDTPGSNRGIWDAFAPQVQSIGLVSEDGATDLVLDSRKPEARQFRRFLTHVVWPAIRDTGSYSAAPAIPPTREERFALALQDAREMLAEKDEQIAIMSPKVEFFDALMEADGTYQFLAVAKMLGWGRTTMLAELRKLGVLQGNNLPYRRYEHHFKVVPQTYVNRKTGETVPTATAYVRPSGIDFLRKKLLNAPLAVVSP